jgi:chlorite dismutase
MTAGRVGLMGLLGMIALLGPGVCFAAADREKLLSEPGVYGTFAAFSVDEEWAKAEQSAKIAYLTAMKGVVEQHRQQIAIDLYLLRGLLDHADILFRLHSAELRDTQKFLNDLQSSRMGQHLKAQGVMHGLTKKANYVPGFPDEMKADLKAASEPGPKPYVIVIPIRKSADWWALGQDKRAEMVKEHTEASLPC